MRIGHDLIGGDGYFSGIAEAKAVTIGGSLIGGRGDYSGGILSDGADLVSVQHRPRSARREHSRRRARRWTHSGFIESDKRIGSVVIGGSIVSGTDGSTGGRGPHRQRQHPRAPRHRLAHRERRAHRQCDAQWRFVRHHQRARPGCARRGDGRGHRQNLHRRARRVGADFRRLRCAILVREKRRRADRLRDGRRGLDREQHRRRRGESRRGQRSGRHRRSVPTT